MLEITHEHLHTGTIYSSCGQLTLLLRHPSIRSLRSIMGRILTRQETDSSGASKVLPASREPGDSTDEADHTDSRTGIIHRVLVNWRRAGKVEGYGGEEKEQETEDVQGDGYWRRECVRALHFCYVAGEVSDQAAD